VDGERRCRLPSQPTSVVRTSSPALRVSLIRAVAVARMFSNTFAGIAPSSVPGFILAECIGALVAAACLVILYPTVRKDAKQVLVPHEDGAAS